MKIKTIKFIILGAFLFSLTYINKDKIPMPEELRSFDFVISSGIDIDLNSEYKDKKDTDAENFENLRSSGDFSISYISSEENSDEETKSNANKNLLNVKSNTLNKAIEKIQSLSNKSFNDSHLEYILIGENTAKENLGYFIDYYSKSPSIRLNVNAFITKDMASEDFIKKILTSKIDADARLHGFVNDKNQLSSMTKKNLKDIMQLFYSKNKTGLIPVLAVEESPIESIGEKNEDDKYTFGFYGLGIIKDGKLTDYIPSRLVRSYLILKKSIKTTDIEITDENGDLSVFSIQNSKSKISFEFDGQNMPAKIIFDVSIDTNYDETTAKENILTDKNINKLNKLQSDKIKSEIEEILEISRKTNADFLEIGEILSMQHPYKWHTIKDDWQDIFKDTKCEINVTAKMKRYLNTNINSQNKSENTINAEINNK